MTNLFASISVSGLNPTHKVKALATSHCPRGLMQGCTGPISRQPRHPSPTSHHETSCHCTFHLVQGLSVLIRFPRGFVHTGVSPGTSTSEMLLGLLRCLSSQGSSDRAQLPGRLTAPRGAPRAPSQVRRPPCPPLVSRCTPSVLLCQGGPPIVRPDPPSRAGNPLSRTPCPPRHGPSAPPGLPPIRSSVQGSQTHSSRSQLPPPELRMRGGRRPARPHPGLPSTAGARGPRPCPLHQRLSRGLLHPPVGPRGAGGVTSGSGSGPGGSTATTRSRRGGRTPLLFTARLAVTARQQVPGPGIRRAQAMPPGVLAPGPLTPSTLTRVSASFRA
ncbi:hypothetical protein NDU88_003923 [Pleurodeles waltl]|uniref:Basic proline-rich protein-like n=1 Tax=Pleurodeles waltl TaxID=8319 RepID=A0AAV7RHZ2_PLEWA|nr:hypothetical protein NDU88_003923 [Pleurodeles waltl]